jgi:POT family proton-dependent oligopeptide transporter
VLVVLFGTGVIDVQASVFAENFAYFLTTIAGIYFVYLYAFAGLNAAERKNVLLLFLLFVAAAAFWSGFDQSGGSLNLFARDYTDLNFMGFDMPVSWVQFFNPIYVVIFAPMFAAFWAFLGRRNLDPSLPLKFALGLLFMALSFVVMLVAVGVALESAPIGLQWLLLTYLLQTWGELTLSPIGLSAFSRYSPKRYVGQMFGLWFLASAIGGVLAGLLGGEATDGGLQSMSPIFSYMIQYYLVIAAILLVLTYFFRGDERRASGPNS